MARSPAWQRKAGKSKSGGLNKKGVASYRKANPGSKLQTAVTTKPSKLKKGSKASKRRKSFCARMKGMKKKLTSSKTARDPNSRINKSLRKWNCQMAKKKSTVNKAGNYTKPGMRKKIFQRIKAGSKGGAPGQWSARKAQLLAVAYKKAGGGYRQESYMHCNEMEMKSRKMNKEKKMPKGNGEKKGLTAKQRNLPPALQKAIAAKKKK